MGMFSWLSWFNRRPPKPPKPPVPPPPAPVDPGWSVDFSKGIPAWWMIADWGAPMGGQFDPSNVSIVEGALRLKLQQVKRSDGVVVSTGAELQTIDPYGFGTYEFTMRAGSTAQSPNGMGSVVSGGISAGFIFVNESETEIDFEVESQYPAQLSCTSYIFQPTKQTANFQTLKPGLHDHFHTYKMVWRPDRIEFYLDGTLMLDFRNVVPARKAFVLLNHWGTNTKDWGGIATPGVDRFMYVTRVSYKPL